VCAKFVGREKELKELLGGLDAAISGKGKMYFVSGDVGIGKTRLLDEIAKICVEKGFIVLRASCLGEGACPYLPVDDALKNFESMFPSQAMPVGLSVAGVSDATSMSDFISGKTMLLEKYLKRFEEITNTGTVLLIIDDIQLADASTLSFIHYLSRSIGKMHMVCVCAYKDAGAESNPAMSIIRNINIERNCTILPLKPLPSDAVAQLVSELLGITEIAHKTLMRIYEHTDGNPLFVEELCKAILDLHLLENQEIKEDAYHVIPQTIRSLISYRLMKLGADELKLLRTCSIFGRVFHYDAILALSEMDESQLVDTLDKLINAGYIREESGREEVYRFTQNIAHDIIYAEISAPRKRIMHKRAGEILEKRSLNKVEYAGEIGMHYYKGAELNKAANYLLQAAEFAFSKYSVEECIAYAEYAKNCLIKIQNVDKKYMFKLLVLLGKARTFLSKFDEAITALNACAEYAPDDKSLAEALLLITEPYLGKGDTKKAMETAIKVREIVSRFEEKELAASAFMTLGWVYERIGSYTEALENYDKALELALAAGNEKIISDAYHRYGTGLLWKPDLNRAKQYLENALEIRKKLGLKELIAGTYNNLAIVVDYLGDIDQALAYYLASKDIYAEIGNVRGIGTAYNNIGGVYQLKGDVAQAMEYYDRYLQISRKTGDLESESIALLNIGVIHKEREAYELAIKYFLETLEIAKKTENKDMIVLAKCYIAECMAGEGDISHAIENVQEAAYVAEETGGAALSAFIESTLGIVYQSAEEWAMAEKHYRKAIDLYTEMRMPQDSSSTMVKLAEVYLAMGRKEDAAELLEKAKEYYTSIGAKAMLEKIEGHLANL